jgi:hypothetical protein
MNKKEFVKMLAEADCDFAVEGNEVIVPYGDTDTEAVFVFNPDGALCETWSRRQNT